MYSVHQTCNSTSTLRDMRIDTRFFSRAPALMVMRKALAEDGFAIFGPRMGNCVFPQFNHIGKLVASSVLLQKELNS